MSITTAQLAAMNRLPPELRTKPKRARKPPMPRVCQVVMDARNAGCRILIDRMKLESEANAHTHWRKRQQRAKQQRQIVRFRMMNFRNFPTMPLVCRITRIAPRFLDSDNLAGSAKAVRDEVAAMFGINDRDETKIKWDVAQDRGAYAVLIEFDPVKL